MFQNILLNLKSEQQYIASMCTYTGVHRTIHIYAYRVKPISENAVNGSVIGHSSCGERNWRTCIFFNLYLTHAFSSTTNKYVNK